MLNALTASSFPISIINSPSAAHMFVISVPFDLIKQAADHYPPLPAFFLQSLEVFTRFDRSIIFDGVLYGRFSRRGDKPSRSYCKDSRLSSVGSWAGNVFGSPSSSLNTVNFNLRMLETPSLSLGGFTAILSSFTPMQLTPFYER